jgi:hypothetical protein
MLPARSSGKRTDAGSIPIPWRPAIKSITRARQGFPGRTPWSLTMRKLLMFLIALGAVVCVGASAAAAQGQPLLGFPPGTFDNIED